MPNWCYSTVRFIGEEEEDIKRLNEDIQKSKEWQKSNRDYMLVPHLLRLNGFDIRAYNDNKEWYKILNARADICSNYMDKNTLDIEMESAWSLDSNLLHLLSRLYNVKFTSYSEEPSMGVYMRCYNCYDDSNRYDFVIIPDPEQLEDKQELEVPYTFPVNLCDNNTLDDIKLLNEYNIDFNVEQIFVDTKTPELDGVYYNHYGVYYE